MRRAARGAAWALLAVVVLGVSAYVGLALQRRVSPPIIPVGRANDLRGKRVGDAVLVRKVGVGDVTSTMLLAVRVKGRVQVGELQSVKQDNDRLVYTLRGVTHGPPVTVRDNDLVGRVDRTVPLLGWLLLGARQPVIDVGAAALVAGTILLLVFVGRTPIDVLFEEDDDVAMPLPAPAPLALPAGPAARPRIRKMTYVSPPMSITPEDLRQVRFAQTRKGYDTEAVDRALDTVADSLELILNEREQLIAHLQSLEAEIEKYRGMESQLGQTLATAERSADQIKAEAHAEAQRILAEAQAQAGTVAPGNASGASVELLGEMRAIRALLQAALQPGGPLYKPPT